MSKLYAYEITASSVESVPVGGCVVDIAEGADSERTWPIWSTATGDWSSRFSGERRDRLCLICFRRPERFIRVDAHPGMHGAGDAYEPSWIRIGGDVVSVGIAAEAILAVRKAAALSRIRWLRRQHEEAMLRAQALRSEIHEAMEGAAGVASPEEIAEAGAAAFVRERAAPLEGQ